MHMSYHPEFHTKTTLIQRKVTEETFAQSPKLRQLSTQDITRQLFTRSTFPKQRKSVSRVLNEHYFSLYLWLNQRESDGICTD